MKISTILDHIDSGYMALPEFQRGYVWNREQVRGLFDSLYRRHPVGGLLVWATESKTAAHRGDGPVAAGVVKLLLDGQQRITSLYGVVRGKPPKFFDGNPKSFSGIQFNVETESFEFYQHLKMSTDPLWVDVTELMIKGVGGLGDAIAEYSTNPEQSARMGIYAGRLSQLIGIMEIDLFIEEVTGPDKTLDVVVDIFNRVNSGGTKLSKGDLALAKICAEWPEARDEMKKRLSQWNAAGYDFTIDWFLRSVNTALTGEAKFLYLHDRSSDEIQDAVKRATKHVETALNMLSGQLGLDHDRVLFGRYAIPVIVRYLDSHNSPLDQVKRDKLLFWFLQAGMWGRFSGSTESFIDQDLAALERPDGGLDRLIDVMRLWHGGLRVEPGHFTGWSLGARFYPVLYLLTRTGGARDWGTGLELKANLLGAMNRLEVHHIFPKAQLYKRDYRRAEVNAIANFCLLTKDTNLAISDRLPEEYFLEIESAHPGALASQWIPMDTALWKVENYRDFLEARKTLLANETNTLLTTLLHGETKWLDRPSGGEHQEPEEAIAVSVGGISSDNEEEELRSVMKWMADRELPPGEFSYDYADPRSGVQLALLDLAWPEGIQAELSQPVALLLNEGADTLAVASGAGFRCFTSTADFKRYVEREILVG